MFTNGILKVFVHQGHYGDINNLQKIVKASGYTAFTHNGKIFVLDKKSESNKWVETCFSISDFDTTSKD